MNEYFTIDFNKIRKPYIAPAKHASSLNRVARGLLSVISNLHLLGKVAFAIQLIIFLFCNLEPQLFQQKTPSDDHGRMMHNWDPSGASNTNNIFGWIYLPLMLFAVVIVTSGYEYCLAMKKE